MATVSVSHMSSNAVNGQQGVERAAHANPGSIRRGNFWEVTYKEAVAVFESLPLEKTADLATAIGVVVTADPPKRAVNLKKRRFEICDFNHFTLQDSSFDDCTFVDCRFIKSDFDGVKFSRCQFETCHFLNVKFRKCQFIDCTFLNISASAEGVLLVETAISATSFIGALVTNLAALPQGVNKNYQEYRHLGTKVKIARAIFISVRDQPELDQLFDANRCFEIALQRRRIADACWMDNGKRLVQRNWLYRTVVRPIRFSALGILQTAGFLTNWGRSPFRSLAFLAAAFVVFSGVYYLAFGEDCSAATLRALDCTFVFGYTKYAAEGPTRAIDWIMFLNAFAGFCWYALLIPALSKRLFR